MPNLNNFPALTVLQTTLQELLRLLDMAPLATEGSPSLIPELVFVHLFPIPGILEA